MRSIKNIIEAHYAPIDDLITYSPLPSREIEQIDPFIFLNHHGPQKYKPGNNGLPFGPHPHRGMETVTFIIEGDIMHKDSGGHKSVINAGGVQWMTAGRGLIHAETSSDEFKEKGGDMEILQLWVNLPAKLKMTEPFYEGMQAYEIPTVSMNDGKVKVDVVSGNWENTKGAFDSRTGVSLRLIYFEEDGKLNLNIPLEENIFFYVIRGKFIVNQKEASKRQLVDFENDSEELRIEAEEKSILLFGHAKPFDEPVFAQGPFVMNSQEEIIEAYNDYRNGKFGTWLG